MYKAGYDKCTEVKSVMRGCTPLELFSLRWGGEFEKGGTRIDGVRKILQFGIEGPGLIATEPSLSMNMEQENSIHVFVGSLVRTVSTHLVCMWTLSGSLGKIPMGFRLFL